MGFGIGFGIGIGRVSADTEMAKISVSAKILISVVHYFRGVYCRWLSINLKFLIFQDQKLLKPFKPHLQIFSKEWISPLNLKSFWLKPDNLILTIKFKKKMIWEICFIVMRQGQNVEWHFVKSNLWTDHNVKSWKTTYKI